VQHSVGVAPDGGFPIVDAQVPEDASTRFDQGFEDLDQGVPPGSEVGPCQPDRATSVCPRSAVRASSSSTGSAWCRRMRRPSTTCAAPAFAPTALAGVRCCAASAPSGTRTAGPRDSVAPRTRPRARRAAAARGAAATSRAVRPRPSRSGSASRPYSGSPASTRAADLVPDLAGAPPKVVGTHPYISGSERGGYS
jgi:hypothetical protein